MSQVDAYTIPGSPLTMAQLAARLEALFGASVSTNRGLQAPTNPVVGMLWWDTSAAPLEVLKVYRSVGWRSILSLNVNSGLLTWLDTIQIAQGGTGATTASVARTNLGLGTAAVQPDTRYNHRSNNLSDVADVTTARQNLGAHNATNLTTGTVAAAMLPSQLDAYASPGDMTSGTLTATKLGRIVVLSWTNMNHPSAGGPFAGQLPTKYWPISGARNLYASVAGTGLHEVIVGSSNGNVIFNHYTSAGSGVSRTAVAAGSLSYVGNAD